MGSTRSAFAAVDRPQAVAVSRNSWMVGRVWIPAVPGLECDTWACLLIGLAWPALVVSVTGSRSSAGGAGGAAGPGFESRALAWFAAHLIARLPVAADWRVSAARVEEIGGQTGHEMDDIGVVTDRRGYIFVQAKHRLQLSDAPDSALGEAVDQAVRQFLDGAPEGPDGSRRALEPGRDALVILTDAAGSAPVRLHLKAVVARFPGLPREKPLDELAKNAPERKALKALLSHLAAAFASHDDGEVPAEDRLRAIGGLLHVIALDLDPGRSDRVNAESHLRGVLDDPASVSGAWNDLVVFGQGLIEGQQWANRDEVRQALASGGHPAGIDPPFRNDVQRLREITRAVLDGNRDEMIIPAPEGTVAIQRDVAGLATGTDGNFALIGEPGAGKSVLVATDADALLEAGQDVVFLGAESLAASLGATRAELGMQHNLDQVLAAWDGLRRGTLIIDGVDATRGTSSVDWLPRLARSLRGTRWRVVATIRTFDLRYGPSWQQMFPGTPLDAAHADPAFAQVRHLLVSDLTEPELAQVRDGSPRLAALISGAEPRLAALLRNPFNLRLAAELAGEGVTLTGIRTRQELLHLYWGRRVELASDRLARRRALRELCESMVGRRRARVADPSAVVDPAVFGAVDGLLHDGVLKEDVQGRQHGVSPVIFSHPVLFDFAVAVTCLHGEDALYLKQRLDSDPDLAITIRPSLDMYFADLWSGDMNRSQFWELALALSTQDHGHPIAAIAAACAALRQHPGPGDLLSLQERAPTQDLSGQTARRCVAHLAAAFDATEISPADRQACTPALAGLAAGLAARAAATGDVGLADLARLILFRLDRAFPLAPDAVAAGPRSRATADVMRCALVSPSGPGSETLANRIAGALAGAVAVDPGNAGPVIDAVIEPQVMTAWGSQVATRLITHIGVIAGTIPDLAARLMMSVWQFDEQSDEPTSISSSGIVGMTSTRKQDLDMARYETGHVFAAFLAASPDAAFQFFASVIAVHAPSYERVRAAGQSPHVYHGESLRYTGHGAINTMARAMITFLTSSAESEDAQVRAVASQLIQAAAAQITHHQFWSLLLEAGAAHPASLGPMLLPLLDGSDLPGHYTTVAFAAKLTAALSASLPAPEHAQLEQIILRARNPLDPAGGRGQELVDMLLGQLVSDRVQDPAARARLAELDAQGGPPAAPESPSAFADYDGVIDISSSTDESGSPDTTGDALQQAAEQVSGDIAGAASGTPEDQEAARQRLRASVPRLNDALMTSGRPPGVPAFEQAFTTLAHGAELLARDPDVLPDTDLGQIVLGILEAALPAEPSSGENS